MKQKKTNNNSYLKTNKTKMSIDGDFIFGVQCNPMYVEVRIMDRMSSTIYLYIPYLHIHPCQNRQHQQTIFKP